MEYLLSCCGGTLTVSPPIVKEAKPFELSPKNDNMRRVYAYLLTRRGIDLDVLNAFVHRLARVEPITVWVTAFSHLLCTHF